MNQNFYKNNKKTNYTPLIIILCISLLIPTSLHIVLKNNKSKDKTTFEHSYDVGYGQDVMIIELLKDISSQLNNLKTEDISLNNIEVKPTNHNEIIWLDSPVMQTWEYNEKGKIWETALPYRESFRSSPTLILGLRDDGVVVWKKIKL